MSVPRQVTMYSCPACNKKCDTLIDAMRCRNGHPIITSDWCYCPTCGAGFRQWVTDRPGRAYDMAEKCRLGHIKEEKS
jgi:hypothetical protein